MPVWEHIAKFIEHHDAQHSVFMQESGRLTMVECKVAQLVPLNLMVCMLGATVAQHEQLF